MLTLLAALPAFDMRRHAGRELSDIDASCGEFLSYDPNDPDAPVPSNFCQSCDSCSPGQARPVPLVRRLVPLALLEWRITAAALLQQRVERILLPELRRRAAVAPDGAASRSRRAAAADASAAATATRHAAVRRPRVRDPGGGRLEGVCAGTVRRTGLTRTVYSPKEARNRASQPVYSHSTITRVSSQSESDSHERSLTRLVRSVRPEVR